MSIATFKRLTALLNEQQARYRVVEHPTAGKSEEVAKIRGTQLGQGAKALLCHVKGNGIKQHVLAILPADKQADLSAVAHGIGGTRASLASPVEVDTLTDCVLALSLRLVSILTYCSLPTRCCLNALTNWPLTQVPLNAQ